MNKLHMFSRSSSRDNVDSNQAKIKRQGNTKEKEQSKMRACFVRMARRPAELGRSSSSDSSCGLSFISQGSALTLYPAFYLQLSCFQSEGTINYCQK